MYTDCHSLISERYPDIGFALNFTEFVPLQLFTDAQGKINAQGIVGGSELVLHGQDIEQDLISWKKDLDLEGIEVLYIFGIGLGYYYECVKEWLHAKQDRRIVLIEEDIAVIDALLQREESAHLIQDPQVHLRFLASRRQQKALLEELSQSFPSDRIAFTALVSYQAIHRRRIKEMHIALMRNTAAIHALMSESLHSHKLFENLLPNFKQLKDAFYANKMQDHFKGVPAIICGAGPSLAASIDTLKKLENKALIIAGGSSLAALSNYGVTPHLGMAFDPNHEEYLRLKPSTTFEVPLLYGNRVLPDIFATCNSPLGYLRSDTGGLSEMHYEDALGIEGEAIGPDLGREAFSVTTLAVALAFTLGCNPIILTGVDLAYTGMQRYAGGVVDDAKVGLSHLKKEKRLTEQLLKKKDRHGKSIYTAVKWIMESSCIGQFAKKHPERLFLNATDGGIGFPHISYAPLAQIAEEYCLKNYDLRGRIHCSSQNLAMTHLSYEKIKDVSQSLYDSLLRAKEMCSQMLQEISKLETKADTLETSKMVLLEMDLQEETAFSSLLAPLCPALDRMLDRCTVLPSKTDPAYRKAKIAADVMKWEQCNLVVQSYIEVFQEHYDFSSQSGKL